MTDAEQVASGELVGLHDVAARNIAAALRLPAENARAIGQAIEDEIEILGSHFALTFADAHASFEDAKAQLAKNYAADLEHVRSAYNWLEEHVWIALTALSLAFICGAITGYVA